MAHWHKHKRSQFRKLLHLSFSARLGHLKLDFSLKAFNIEILYLSIIHRTFKKREFYEKWQGGDINMYLLLLIPILYPAPCCVTLIINAPIGLKLIQYHANDNSPISH